LLHRTLVANGTKRHFAAAQQTVAIGGKADKRHLRDGSGSLAMLAAMRRTLLSVEVST
jgi:hypothetical protein